MAWGRGRRWRARDSRLSRATPWPGGAPSTWSNVSGETVTVAVSNPKRERCRASTQKGSRRITLFPQHLRIEARLGLIHAHCCPLAVAAVNALVPLTRRCPAPTTHRLPASSSDPQTQRHANSRPAAPFTAPHPQSSPRTTPRPARSTLADDGTRPPARARLRARRPIARGCSHELPGRRHAA